VPLRWNRHRGGFHKRCQIVDGPAKHVAQRARLLLDPFRPTGAGKRTSHPAMMER
jgi:hypothetical protein